MSETKKVKAVKAVEAVAEAKPTPVKAEKPAKPAKLKFQPVVSSYKISAGEVRTVYNEVVEQIKDMLNDELTSDFNGIINAQLSDADLAFLDNSEVLLAAIVKNLENGLNPLEYIESYEIAQDLKLDKLFGKELKALTQKMAKEFEAKLKEAAEAKELEQAAALKAAELNKTHGAPIRVKKAHAEKAAQLLKDAGIDFVDA